MKKEITFLMDEKRNLFIRDEDGIEYNFWALGWGIPVSLMVETDAEQAANKKREQDAREADAARYREIKTERMPWYRKLFTRSERA